MHGALSPMIMNEVHFRATGEPWSLRIAPAKQGCLRAPLLAGESTPQKLNYVRLPGKASGGRILSSHTLFRATCKQVVPP